MNYDDDDYSQGYHQIKEAFKALTKNDILKQYISDHEFRPPNIRADGVGYKIYVFFMRCRKNFTKSQPIKVELQIDGVVPNVMNRNALVLRNTLVSIGSDGQRHFDLI